jgi:hypothetical protein
MTFGDSTIRDHNTIHHCTFKNAQHLTQFNIVIDLARILCGCKFNKIDNNLQYAISIMFL